MVIFYSNVTNIEREDFEVPAYIPFIDHEALSIG
jgi:hypothetical protein